MVKARNIKDILNSPEFMAQREKTARYLHHEFQDYAMRLANDLGDVNHKVIYMRLARREDRMMLEQAAAFAMGYFKEINKGKIFMWKLQQLKLDKERRESMRNLNGDFVLKRMGQSETELIDVYSAKQKSLFNQHREDTLNLFAQIALAAHSGRGPAKIWNPGCGIGLDAAYLQRLGFKVSAQDLSAALVKRAKLAASTSEVTRKLDPLDNKFKPQTLAGIWCGLWTVITLENEAAYFTEFKTKLAKGGALVLEVDLGDAESQSWREFEWQKSWYIRFEKTNLESALIAKADESGFSLMQKFNTEKSKYCLLFISDKQ